jgi:inner membrane protein
MDNLTHTLAGAVLGESGLKRRTRLAIPTLLIGANLPDLDVIAILFGESLPFRRGWTHGVLALAILPLVLAAVMTAWDRWRRGSRPDLAPADPRQLLLLSYLAVLSHPFLDWLNTYGMRWLMPFDGRWFYGDALFIVDPWVLLLLTYGVFWTRRTRSRRAATLALAAASLYVVTMLGTAWYGRSLITRTILRNGIVADEVMVGPVPINPFRREVVIRDGERYFAGTLDWLPGPVLRVGEPILANLDHPLAVEASRFGDVGGFLVWSRFPFYTIEDREDRWLVILDDLRYGRPGRHSWFAVRIEVPLMGSGEGWPMARHETLGVPNP